jgi:hypothetical protein
MGVGSSGDSSSAGSSSGALVPSGSCCPSCSTGTAHCDGATAGSATTAAAGGCSWQQGLCGDADMQHMLAVFMNWQQAVYDHITSRYGRVHLHLLYCHRLHAPPLTHRHICT